MITSGTLTAGHARALITAPNATELALKVVGKGLSVRETEELVRKTAVPAGRKGQANRAEKDADTRALEADLSAGLGMMVQISHDISGAGRLTIGYRSLEDLDLLCSALSAVSLEASLRKG